MANSTALEVFGLKSFGAGWSSQYSSSSSSDGPDEGRLVWSSWSVFLLWSDLRGF